MNLIALVIYLISECLLRNMCGGLGVLIKLVFNCVLSTVFAITNVTPVVSFSKVDGAVDRVKFFDLPELIFFANRAPMFSLKTFFAVTVIFLISTTRAAKTAATMYGKSLSHSVGVRRLRKSLTISKFSDAVSKYFKYLPLASFDRGVKLMAVANMVGQFAVLVKTLVLVLTSLFPPLKTFFGSLPRSMLNKYAIVVFNSVLCRKVGVLGSYRFGSHAVVVMSLTFYININLARASTGFFDTFPRTIKSVFGKGTITNIFMMSLLLDLVLPGSGDGGMGRWQVGEGVATIVRACFSCDYCFSFLCLVILLAPSY